MPAVKVAGLDESDYRVIYGNCYGVGTAKVTIEARGSEYKGEIVKYYTINPRKAVISGVKAGRRRMTVKAKTKVGDTGGSHYQINYKVKGAKNWKSVKTTRRTLTIRKLKKGKKYQVKIRAYKKTGGKTYYGAWSTVRISGNIRWILDARGNEEAQQFYC